MRTARTPDLPAIGPTGSRTLYLTPSPPHRRRRAARPAQGESFSPSSRKKAPFIHCFGGMDTVAGSRNL